VLEEQHPEAIVVLIQRLEAVYPFLLQKRYGNVAITCFLTKCLIPGSMFIRRLTVFIEETYVG